MDFKHIDEGHSDGEEPLHFYSHREDRLAHAPKNVRDYYEKGFEPKRGLFRVLVATRGNRLLLITVGICFFVVVFFGFFGGNRNEKTLFGIPVKLSAFSFEDTVYVSVQLKDQEKKPRERVSLPVPVVVQIRALNTDKQVVQKIVLSGKYTGKEEFLRTTFRDYDILAVQADVEITDKQESLSASVEQH